MSQKPVTQRAAVEKVVKYIRRATRKQHSAEEKIRIVLDGLRGEDSIADGLHGIENALDAGDLLLRQRRREDPRVRPQGIEEV